MNLVLKTSLMQRTSPSAVVAFQACARKWAFQYLLGYRSPQSPPQILGDGVHLHLEHYLAPEQVDTTKLDPKLAMYVAMAAPHLPRPAPVEQRPYLVEHGIFFNTGVDGLMMKGYIDLVEHNTIHDHKCKSSHGYNLSPNELLYDTQLNCYAQWFYTVYKPSYNGELVLKHLNISYKSPRKAVPEAVNTTREKVADNWQKIQNTIRAMCATAVPDITDDYITTQVPLAEYSTCMKYGGCEFLGKCNPTNPRAIQVDWYGENKNPDPNDFAFLGESKMPTLSEMLTKTNSLAPVATVPSADVAKHPSKIESNLSTTGKNPSVSGMTLSQIAESKALAAEALSHTVSTPHTSSVSDLGSRVQAAGVAPPDEPEPAALEEAQAAAEAPKRGRGRPKKAALAGTADNPAQRIVELDADGNVIRELGRLDPAKVAAEARAPRGEVPLEVAQAMHNLSNGNPPAIAQAEKILADFTSTAASPLAAMRARAAPATDKPLALLLIGCVPVKHTGQVTYVEDWLAPLTMQIAEENGVVDWRGMPYNDGEKALAVAVKRRISAMQTGALPWPEVLVVPKFGKASEIILAAFFPLAQHVIQGV